MVKGIEWQLHTPFEILIKCATLVCGFKNEFKQCWLETRHMSLVHLSYKYFTRKDNNYEDKPVSQSCKEN